MTFSHQNSNRNGLFLKNNIKKRYYTFLAISTLELTFWWPWINIALADDPESTK